MPRNITVTLADGSQHVYANAPDNLTPDAVSARAQKDFGQPVTALDGGRGAPPARSAAPAPAGPPSVRNAFGLGKPPGPKGTPERATYDAEYNKRFNAAYTAANPPTVAQKIKAAGKNLAENEGGSDFGNAILGGIRKATFGLADRGAALAQYAIPSGVNIPLLGISGTPKGVTFDNILQTIRARNEAETDRSMAGNITGQILGGGGVTRMAGGLVARGGAALAETASPIAARVGNFLQGLTTLNKGQKVANAAKLVTGGAAAGATQALGDDQNVGEGALIGGAGAGVLGVGFKAAQVITRPFRDVLRLSSAPQILSRLTSSTREQLTAAAERYRAATGAEPTLFELLPLADRNKILKKAVVGRDGVVEQTSNAIRSRAANLGPEMSARARAILEPDRNFNVGDIHRDMTAARNGVAEAADAPLAANAANSPTDLLALRDTEARAIMAPHDNTPVTQNLDDLYPHVESTDAQGNIQRVSTDPEVQALIRSAAGTLTRRPQGAGVNASDVSDMIQTLRGDLSKGGIEGRTAQRAIDHLEGELAVNAPDAAAAHTRMTDAYAARSRMAEGMQEGVRTRLRNDVQVGTNRGEARRVRNAYDTPEGAAGRSLGQGNKILGDLAGSPEEALRETVKLSRNSIGPELSQNVGADQAQGIMAAARAQDESAQALASASQKAQSGGDGAGGVEALVQGIAGLHPGGFITTKLGAVNKLSNIGIPENRARTIVDMIFSQDPTMMRRALNAVGNSPKGAGVLQYLTAAVGQAVGGADNAPDPADPNAVAPPQAAPGAEQAPGAPEEAEPAPDADNADMAPAAADESQGQPVDEASSPYAPQLQQIYDTENPELLKLIERQSGQESGGRQHDENGRTVTSSAGAIGIMQVLPSTAPEAAKLAGVPFDENAFRNDPAYNKLLGIAYMSELLRKYKGDVAKSLAAYNAGAGRVNAAIRKGGENGWINHVPAETQDYVQKVA